MSAFIVDLERVRQMVAGAGLSPSRAADLLEKLQLSLADAPPASAQAPKKQPESNVLPIRNGM